MESPQRASAACARSEKSGLSDVSFPRPDSPLLRQSDSFAESQQCSADPSAFLGFHVPPSAEEVDVAPPKDPQPQSKKKTFKLVLDLGLDSTSGADDGCRPLQSPANPFSELFAGDTQDDENLMATRAPIIAEEKEKEKKKKEENSTQKKNIEREKEHVSPPKRRRQSEEEKEGDRSPSPPPTMLMSIDKELRDRKQKVTAASAGEVKEKDEESHDEMRLEDSLPGASAFSEYSEDLAPRVFQTFATNVEAAAIDEKSALVEGDNERFDRSAYITEDSDRETDLEEDMELTQKLDDEEVDVVMDSKDVTRSYAASSGDDEEETEAFPYSGTGTEPYGPDSACMDDDHDELAKNAGNQTLDMSVNGGGSHHVPTPSQKSDQRTSDDDVTSRECTQQDYLTPRVNPNQIDNADSAEVNEKSVVVSDKQNSNKSPDEDDQDECMATQPSRGRTESEPAVEPNSPGQPKASKKHDAVLTTKPTGTDSQTKASRALEFSFSMPESQEGEPHFSASLSSDGVVVSKSQETFSRNDRPTPFESSISPVWPPTPTPTPTPVDGPFDPEATVVTSPSQEGPKRKAVSSLQSGLPTGKKKQKTLSQTSESPRQTTSPSKPMKRKRGFFSPGSNASSKESDSGDPLTPRPPARRSTRSAQSTPSSSTPTVRTRTRNLTPVPAHRAYASRSRTLFKYKFEFCLTGFVKTGEENLKELIEGHGGKIPERYQDVLYKNNRKAVVIATPVSWRKRKFMQAIACGIPVVHTDWLKDCIEAGYVVPFDGYQVPAGYSVTTRKFECFTPRELNIFEGYSFGIATDVEQVSKAEAKDKANLMAFILKACGADAVYENISAKSDVDVDIVLCSEYTQTCRYYKKRRRVLVKDFQWVTECMILQQFLDPEEDPVLEPQRVGCEDVFSASAEIGDSDRTTLKLYTGELVMADISGSAADHYLLFNVCEILSIHVSGGRKDEGSQSKRKDKESRVMLHVGMLKREPYNPELSKTPVKVLDISSSQVKRRVVAISKEDYGRLKYKDESIFCVEDASEPDKPTLPEHRWLTQ
ncbi:hypothetical protein PF005_g19961 [Phytophthora fragariae]|uniref:BRCT domain-containing protein n=1 Tax=Phytophthora fragariae TaxID=53985 RepID=A0A6A3SJ71_9STRA|nr:hypothetical protein PF003_g9582 [Phytophthora fragariae]KAE8929196.1 hypothetical protein PF009_g20677 [Phytophthora fragariae]KAE8989883.1 hypothetical protein PF011_g18580 [Phytophthora fragariae]KAE9088284.1 hypothetical protein PF007_g20033 [Phytophthora fragariae]KAE9117918.1 hypothetical protein PF006_g18708 [Phytophthora fragariae]